MLTVFALVSAVAFHVLLAQGQLRLDRLDQEISSAQRDYEQLRLQTAEQSSPSRIVAAAQRLGLVQPAQQPTYLQVAGAPTDGATAPADGVKPVSAWKKVKQSLATEP